MKIARWTGTQGLNEGFVIDHKGQLEVVPFPEGRTVTEVLTGGLPLAQDLFNTINLASGVPLENVTLQVPLVPASIRDFVAFEEHVEGVSGAVDGKNEVVPEWYEAPTFYFTNPHTTRATAETVAIPQTQRLDFELELAAIIGGVAGSDGQNLDVAAAGQHIFGYTVMNDWSARDLQSREMRVRLGPCKGKDFGMTLGPWIVTADEVEQYVDSDGALAVKAEAYVNGTPVGEDLVSNMGWNFAELVAYAARNSVVVPGDVLGSGTVGNGGCLGELWGRGSSIPPLEPGDQVRLVIEGVGEITNTVGERVVAPQLPPARKRKRWRSR